MPGMKRQLTVEIALWVSLAAFAWVLLGQPVLVYVVFIGPAFLTILVSNGLLNFAVFKDLRWIAIPALVSAILSTLWLGAAHERLMDLVAVSEHIQTVDRVEMVEGPVLRGINQVAVNQASAAAYAFADVASDAYICGGPTQYARWSCSAVVDAYAVAYAAIAARSAATRSDVNRAHVYSAAARSAGSWVSHKARNAALTAQTDPKPESFAHADFVARVDAAAIAAANASSHARDLAGPVTDKIIIGKFTLSGKNESTDPQEIAEQVASIYVEVESLYAAAGLIFNGSDYLTLVTFLLLIGWVVILIGMWAAWTQDHSSLLIAVFWLVAGLALALTVCNSAPRLVIQPWHLNLGLLLSLIVLVQRAAQIVGCWEERFRATESESEL